MRQFYVVKCEIAAGIVIKAARVKDADVAVRILTADGIKAVTAVGAARANAKLKGAVQIFSAAEFSIMGARLVGAHIISTPAKIVKDIRRYYLACAIAEVVLQCRGAGYQLTLEAIEQLNTDGADCRKIFTAYFGGLLEELGYATEPDVDINTSFLRHLDIVIPNTAFYL